MDVTNKFSQKSNNIYDSFRERIGKFSGNMNESMSKEDLQEKWNELYSDLVLSMDKADQNTPGLTQLQKDLDKVSEEMKQNWNNLDSDHVQSVMCSFQDSVLQDEPPRDKFYHSLVERMDEFQNSVSSKLSKEELEEKWNTLHSELIQQMESSDPNDASIEEARQKLYNLDKKIKNEWNTMDSENFWGYLDQYRGELLTNIDTTKTSAQTFSQDIQDSLSSFQKSISENLSRESLQERWELLNSEIESRLSTYKDSAPSFEGVKSSFQNLSSEVQSQWQSWDREKLGKTVSDFQHSITGWLSPEGSDQPQEEKKDD